ncbi:hypothetical protein WJX81_004730 [Elliptochloris bilobata]|uniref:Ion transport domain-containing protein n=1 Tax=Elliptochloris bilobata TaxID=381761 RepID=A0AAW1RCZ5_9CHLO
MTQAASAARVTTEYGDAHVPASPPTAANLDKAQWTPPIEPRRPGGMARMEGSRRDSDGLADVAFRLSPGPATPASPPLPHIDRGSRSGGPGRLRAWLLPSRTGSLPGARGSWSRKIWGRLVDERGQPQPPPWAWLPRWMRGKAAAALPHDKSPHKVHLPLAAMLAPGAFFARRRRHVHFPLTEGGDAPSAPACYSALAGPGLQDTWMWLDGAEDIAFGVDILLSAAAALAQDLRLFDAAAGGDGAIGAGGRALAAGSAPDDKAGAAAGGLLGGSAAQPGLQQEGGGDLQAHVAAVLSSGHAAESAGEARGWGRLASLARHPAPEAPGSVAPGQPRRVSWLKQLAEAADMRLGAHMPQARASVGSRALWQGAAAAYAARQLPFEAGACLLMWLPILAHWPLWSWMLLQLSRVPRIWRLYSYFRRHELMVHVNIRHIAAAKFVVLVLGAAHALGCLWFLLARWARFSAALDDESWLAQFRASTGIGFGCSGDATPAGSYTVIIYKGLNLLSNLGLDPTVPRRWDEIMMASTVMLCGVIMQAYILGTLFHYLVKRDPKLEAFRQLLRSVCDYCRARGLPAQLEARLLRYFRFQAAKHSDSDGARILRALPDSLRARVAQHQFGGVLQRNQALFRGCAAQFEGALLGRLREART